MNFPDFFNDNALVAIGGTLLLALMVFITVRIYSYKNKVSQSTKGSNSPIVNNSGSGDINQGNK